MLAAPHIYEAHRHADVRLGDVLSPWFIYSTGIPSPTAGQTKNGDNMTET
jgi:hypothetical protein